jgi:hypothetical protein
MVHLIRNSLAFVFWKDRKSILPGIKAIYRVLSMQRSPLMYVIHTIYPVFAMRMRLPCLQVWGSRLAWSLDSASRMRCRSPIRPGA